MGTSRIIASIFISSFFISAIGFAGTPPFGDPPTYSDNPFDTISGADQPTTKPSSPAEALTALQIARAHCIGRLQLDKSYTVAADAELADKKAVDSASDDERPALAAKLLASRSIIRKMEAAAFAADKNVIEAQKDLETALADDAEQRAEATARTVKAQQEEADKEAAAAYAAQNPPVPNPGSIRVGMTLDEVINAMRGPGKLTEETADYKIYVWYGHVDQPIQGGGIGRYVDARQQLPPALASQGYSGSLQLIISVVIQGEKVTQIQR